MIHRKDQQAKVAAHRIARRLLELGHLDYGLRLGQAAEGDLPALRDLVRAALAELTIPEEVAQEMRRILDG